jgi:hypothetical protein
MGLSDPLHLDAPALMIAELAESGADLDLEGSLHT